MATAFKFNCFVEDLGLKVHDLQNDTLKIYLTNAAPDAAADSVKADLAEISGGNGYTAGGHDAQCSWSESGGTASLTGTDITITASGGTIGPFRYAVLYNDTSASDSLILAWDYGSSITLGIGESIVVDFAATIGTLA